MKRLIPLLIILAACGDGGEGGRRVLEPSRLRIVAGDAQTSPVAASTAAGAVFRVYAAGDAATGVLPDTLITEIQGTIEGRDGIMGVSGNVELPPGTSVEYTVLQDGCGAPYIASVNPDSDARTRTLWEIPGARQNLTAKLQGVRWHVVGSDSVWAARCEMEARLKVGPEFRADTTFVAYFEPGPAHTWEQSYTQLVTMLPDSTWLSSAGLNFLDVHGNYLPHRRTFWRGPNVRGGETWDTWRYVTTEERTDTVYAEHGDLRVAVPIHTFQDIEGWVLQARCDGPAILDPRNATTPVVDSASLTFVLGGESVTGTVGAEWVLRNNRQGQVAYEIYYEDPMMDPRIHPMMPSLAIMGRNPGTTYMRAGFVETTLTLQPDGTYAGTNDWCVGGVGRTTLTPAP